MNWGKSLSFAVMSVVLSACSLTGADKDTEKIDTHFSGAYQFPDGTIFTLGPSTAEKMRMLRYKDGQPFSLYHSKDNGFQVSEGFKSKEFFAQGKLTYSEAGDVTGAQWQQDNEQLAVTRLPINKEEVFFQSGDLKLRGELSIPEGEQDFPVVITVHGSEDYSAVDYYHWPYMLAAHGIAGFKFDKRGTGGSEGEYTQNFPTLAGDVIAAIDYLKANHNIDPKRINLIGFSQAGWIMPLVAKQVDIQSYIVGFGTTVPVPREDRWGYVKRLLDNGYGEEEIAAADAMNDLLNQIIRYHNEDAWDDLFALKEQYEDAEWFNTVSGSDSMLGFVAQKITHPLANFVPNFGWKLYTRWKKGGNSGAPGFNQTYQPLDTLRQVHSPSLWLLSGEDTSLPTPETVEELTILQSEGLPIVHKVYPGAEHGNIEYITDENGERTYTRYVPTYFTDVVEWFSEQNAL